MRQIKSEFKDVIGNELPTSISYTGKFKHGIDLITDSKLTYNRPYRLSMEEREELEKQIDELVKAGRNYPTTSPHKFVRNVLGKALKREKKKLKT